MGEETMESFDVAIVGMGASGALVAAQLARQAKPGKGATVVCYSGDKAFGKGVAYGTVCSDHLLNVPAGKMSAFPDEPDHFVRWLRECWNETIPADDLSNIFAERRAYGAYLERLFNEALYQDGGLRLSARHDSVRSITKLDSQSYKITTDAAEVVVKGLVLALGNLPPKFPSQITVDSKLTEAGVGGRVIEDPWRVPWYKSVATYDTVCVLGTGLTMIDMVIALKREGHRGVIYAVSRHGLLPWCHDLELEPVKPELLKLAGGDKVRMQSLVRNFRKLAVSECNPRQVIDSLRASTPDLWQKLSEREGRRFLRHLSTYWDVLRHRVAPAIDQQVQEAIRDQSLVVKAGRVGSIALNPEDNLIKVDFLGRKSEAGRENLMVDYIVNCTGPTNFTKGYPVCLESLVREGILSFDRYGMGLKVNAACKVADAPIWGIGPMCRGTFWETTAMPEIRVQAQNVAASIVKALNLG
jgi:uncharacterized NAD(P)/FAD-binding protein YdhS